MLLDTEFCIAWVFAVYARGARGALEETQVEVDIGDVEADEDLLTGKGEEGIAVGKQSRQSQIMPLF